MNSCKNRFLFGFAVCIFSCMVLLGGCGQPRSSVSFSVSAQHPVPLYALNQAAKTGTLAGDSSTAWFSFSPVKSSSGKALEVAFSADIGEPVTLSLSLVFANDLTPLGALTGSPAPRNLSTVRNATGEIRIRMILPESGSGQTVSGFAVRAEGNAEKKVHVLGASIQKQETGWQKKSQFFWAGFGPEGGSVDIRSLVPGAVVPQNSVLELSFAPGVSTGTITRQARTAFSSSTFNFTLRTVPAPYNAYVPSAFFNKLPADVSVPGGVSNLEGMRVLRNLPVMSYDSGKTIAPIMADPFMMIEWPRKAWRKSDWELFAWDRFPTILIFDTANYAVQDRLFKRLAFYVEKQGYKGKLWPDSALASLHAYNAHDYRSASLDEFFEQARKEHFALNTDEVELRNILLAEGIIRKNGDAYSEGAGAVLSFSRESVAYLRYLFVTHEGFHGIYFTDPDFRAEVARVYQAMDKRALAFLQGYFTKVDALGYDTKDSYLMENEFMAYLLQQPLDKVEPYFTGNLLERFVRHGGNKELARYIAETKAADFVKAATELNDYVFGRWGLAGGRTGLFIPN
jgi:hypothetical protein